MAYTDANTIHNPTTGQVIPAAWGDQIRDNQEFFIDPPACSVYDSGTTNVANTGVYAVLSADSENFDNNAMHSTSTNNSRITIQTAGRYLFIATVFYPTASTSERAVRFLLNGTTVYQGTKVNSNTSGSQNTILTTSRTITCAASDYVEATAAQRSTTNPIACQLDEFVATYLTR